jgi:flavin reductase (DIM6/NTAB) family NADH-FMN oxidoreductase RutF
VAESPVALECRLHSTLEMGDCVLVFGEVTHAAVAFDVLEGRHPLIAELDPLSRLGLDEWGAMGPVSELKRIRKDDWPGDFRPTDRPGDRPGG